MKANCPECAWQLDSRNHSTGEEFNCPECDKLLVWTVCADVLNIEVIKEQSHERS